eukprot:6638524-Alexandrium_andersonii.AAC.1
MGGVKWCGWDGRIKVLKFHTLLGTTKHESAICLPREMASPNKGSTSAIAARTGSSGRWLIGDQLRHQELSILTVDICGEGDAGLQDLLQLVGLRIFK